MDQFFKLAEHEKIEWWLGYKNQVPVYVDGWMDQWVESESGFKDCLQQSKSQNKVAVAKIGQGNELG